MLRGIVVLFILLATLAGCTRRHYRTLTDADAYSILEEKSWGTPWMPPGDYNVLPHPTSRFFDPTPVEDPLLPLPAPQLYAFDLPSLPERDPARFRPDEALARQEPGHPFPNIPVSHTSPLPPFRRNSDFQRLPPVAGAIRTPSIRAVAYDTTRPPRVASAELNWQDPANQPPDELPIPALESDLQPTGPRDDESGQLVLNPIPESNWEAIPATCLPRIFEFESIREEYLLTYGRPVSEDQLDPAPRLALEDIVELAQINSREYQTQKETLYRAALALSLERFDYDLKFSANGHRTTVDYTHSRTAGITVNSLSVPTTFSADKMLITGGGFLARFANSVVLTFNGPQGFAADIGSDLLFDFSQSVLQRDIQFEQLTQAERNVIYAARDFARFRKTLFTGLTNDYYSLITTYRRIEITAQNYFSFVRTFRQTEAEYQADLLSRLQVDLIEADVFSGLSGLISICNTLEQSLDGLKIRIGLPTETPVNLDLTELEQLTLRDELSVTRELIQRVVSRIDAERGRPIIERVVLLSAAEVLAERILAAYDLQERLDQQVPDRSELAVLQSSIQVEIARYRSDEASTDLETEKRSESPSDPIIFQRTIDTLDELGVLINSQLDYAERIRPGAAEITRFKTRNDELKELTNTTRAQEEQLLTDPRALVDRASGLLDAAEQLVRELDLFNGFPEVRPGQEELLQQALANLDRLGVYSDEVIRRIGEGLVPVDIDVDDAMLTALVLRFDLMNERGLLADDWRAIKLAGDDLKSVLNLNAAQTIGTPRDRNRPFAFTFDESRTDLALVFDLPLNRRAQRNLFRRSLINYNAGLRQLMQEEDSVKFQVRNDLRNLAVGRAQYSISVRAAALAYERLVSTRLEFLVSGEATARDFSEAQIRYTTDLNDVASEHIDYITDRLQLFLDLELLILDENGFWPELYDEQFQPEPFYQLPGYALPAYGELPHVWYSKRIKRMLYIPPGTSMIHREQQPDDQREPAAPAPYDLLPTPPQPEVQY